GEGQCLTLAERGRDQAHVRPAPLGESQRLGAAVRGPGHPDVPLPTEKRPRAVSPRMVIVNDQQIDLVSGVRVVAIPAAASLAFKLSLKWADQCRSHGRSLSICANSPYNVASDGL